MKTISKKFIIIFAVVALIALVSTAALVYCVLQRESEYISGQVVADNSKTDYVLVYPTSDDIDVDNMYYDVINYTKRKFTAYTNTEIREILDYEQENNTNFPEIVFGSTDRYEYSEEEIESLGHTGFIVRTSEHKIFIIANYLTTYKKAIDYLFTSYADKDLLTLKVPIGLNTVTHIPELEILEGAQQEIAGSITYGPTVFVTGDNYQIIYHSNIKGAAWVEVDGIKYYDEYAGIIKSESVHHVVTVPIEALDNAKSYKINFTPVYNRKAYSPVRGANISKEYSFRPVDTSDGLQVYSIADSHSNTEACVKAADFYGDKLDMLVLCGDIVSECHSDETIYDIATIAYAVTKGNLPVVFARGNHDIRGAGSELIASHVGTNDGNMFFTFRLGNIWGVVLDCGEDKDDGHVEYGGLVYFEKFRKAQTEFLKNVITNADSEYNAPGIEYRIAICHIPFPISKEYAPAPEIFNEWTAMLSQMNIDIMLSGHKHKIYVKKSVAVNGVISDQRFPVVVGSTSNVEVTEGIRTRVEYTGTAMEIKDGTITINFTDTSKNIVSQETRVHKSYKDPSES